MNEIHVETEVPLADAHRHALGRSLLAYHATQYGDPDYTTVGLYLRTDEGETVGGLAGRLRWRWWRWLYVEMMWVADELRGLGLGSRLLEAAHQFARRRGGVAVHLETSHPDALRFYLGHGYRVVGTMEGFPPGATQHFLCKRLVTGFPDGS